MTSPARTLPAPFADPLGAQRALRLAAVEHPEWCDRTRCEVRLGSVRHIGHPVYWHGQGDDIEFSLSKLQRDDDPAGYLLGLRRTAEIETFEVELLARGEIDSFPIARARLEMREQEIEGDPREELDAEPAADEAQDVTAAQDLTAVPDHE